jgi:uncharacterized protein (TIGR02271 family)
MRTVVGLFNRFEDAQKVVQALRDGGFKGEDISLVARDRSGEYTRYLQGQKEGQTENIADGAAAGAGVGAVLGGLGGILLGLGALAIPGIGPVVAAGPIAAGLAGAGAGAVAGGIVGALVDLGVPEDQANRYAEGIRRGGSLVTVRTQDEMANKAAQIMNRFNPVDVRGQSRQWQQNENWSRFDANARPLTEDQFTGLQGTDHGETSIPVVEEDIEVGKRDVEREGVNIHAYVEEIPVEKDVNLRREHIEVERRPVDREITGSGDQHFVEGELHLTQHEEQPMVRKTARVTEEVHVRKDVDERQETVRDTVRRQRVDVSKMSPSDWQQTDRTFQDHYRTTYGSRGHDYNYYQDAYRYGYTLANDDRYQNRDWSSIETDARRRWESEHRDTAWDDVKDAIRYGWESLTGQR